MTVALAGEHPQVLEDLARLQDRAHHAAAGTIERVEVLACTEDLAEGLAHEGAPAVVSVLTACAVVGQHQLGQLGSSFPKAPDSRQACP